MKKHFWKLEYSITLFVLLGFLMMFVPVRFENYLQARFITKWNDRYEKAEYMFNVINAQVDDEILKSFANAKNAQEREKLLTQLIKPYKRLHQTERLPRRYRTRFLNGSKVPKNSEFYFNDLYFSDMQIVGIKDLQGKALFMMMFDINGVLLPNTWGRDIFGIYIYDGGIVEPFGYSENMENLANDCSKKGLGLFCSYYYRIGGEFRD